MSLTLSPEVEAAVEERARKEGVSANDLLARTFGANGTPGIALTDTRERVLKVLDQLRANDKTPAVDPVRPLPGETSLEALFREWQDEDAELTADEVEAEKRLWEDYKRSINESRAEAGMRLLF